ncbi:maleate cis-trans isomerase family protein [Seohaeicola zhoushanensis]|uniref:Asp/Glu racemase n=1 Tax=Seohaeicola zhoushanensis TaxID=1569283 RepID=A0A8J3GZ11_9RHOB|nr:aspartate/glutamate racemase family protein [Seohaeicola zhoushanensis]GHF56476.1 Asp/Glu racemase [Seohaeicola zhoushanensis]
MQTYSYVLKPADPPRLGLIVLQTDERIEPDFRRLLPVGTDLFVSRVPSGLDVTPETLQAMHDHIPASAALLPQVKPFDVVGYGCTSGSAQIGPANVARQVRAGTAAQAVTEPVSALVAACRALGVNRVAFLSPYVEAVSDRLREVLAGQGVTSPVFGTFAEAEEAKVSRIDPISTRAAALNLLAQGGVDALFLSCTNLDTLDIITGLEADSGLPVLSSNLVLAWHMARLAGVGQGQCLADTRLGRTCP